MAAAAGKGTCTSASPGALTHRGAGWEISSKGEEEREGRAATEGGEELVLDAKPPALDRSEETGCGTQAEAARRKRRTKSDGEG